MLAKITKKTKKQAVIAISGIKNSGKTTLITKLIPILRKRGLSIATVKHDGHDFDLDVKGTDTYKHIKSGANATAIFSKNKYMIINNRKDISEKLFINHFKKFDIILLEGFKYSHYKKIELVRKGISNKTICDEKTVLAVATDIKNLNTECKVVNLNDVNKIAHVILKYYREVVSGGR